MRPSGYGPPPSALLLLGMLVLIAKRLFAAIVLLIFVSALSFELIVVAPSDAFAESQLRGRTSPETVAMWRHRAGLDLPPYRQYLRWLGGLMRGDAGYSFKYDAPVMELILPRLGSTLLLSLLAYALAWAIGLPLGLIAAVIRWRWIDRVLYVLATMIISLPRIFLAFLAILFAAHTGWLPIGGKVSLDHDQLNWVGQGVDLAQHALLPVLVLSLYPLALYFLQVRSSLSETMTADFVKTARAKGLSESRVVVRHALRNSIHPLITLFGYSIGDLLGGAALVETIMSWPGMGRLTVEAVFARDSYVILAVVLISSTMLVLGNFLADLLLAVFDPRVKLEA